MQAAAEQRRALWEKGPRRAPGAASVAGSTAPERAGLVLFSLILVAVVANLNLSVANVALPDIGKAFDSSQYRAQDRGRLAGRPEGRAQ